MATETKATPNYVVGSRPQHTHHCSAGHDWQCNSPYCEDMQTDCPEHGGFQPIVQGHEPWKGNR